MFVLIGMIKDFMTDFEFTKTECFDNFESAQKRMLERALTFADKHELNIKNYDGLEFSYENKDEILEFVRESGSFDNWIDDDYIESNAVSLSYGLDCDAEVLKLEIQETEIQKG